jgi:3-methyladenine DNA glycosylase AlkC
MGEPFKNLLDAALVQRIGTRLAQADAGFDVQRFALLARQGLEALELKARALQICEALEATLPEPFERAALLLEQAMEGAEGLEGWALWPVGEYVARRGLHEPERALAVLRRMTPRFSAEFAIRPLIVQHPELVFATLARWAMDDDEHVRRLVSEGSRPRLPWGLRLQALVKDPSPTLPLLLALQDDPSEYVRRSVANHLNDIAKDHPELVVAWLREHLIDATPERRALLRHASRTLIKKCHAPTLRVWGQGQPLRGSATLKLAPKRARVGDTLALTLTLVSNAARQQPLLIDYALHRVLASGSSAPKVFKGWSVELAAGDTLQLSKRHSLREVTTRRVYPGRHRIEIVINGRVAAQAEFDLRLG